jgi:hypothetical protein
MSTPVVLQKAGVGRQWQRPADLAVLLFPDLGKVLWIEIAPDIGRPVVTKRHGGSTAAFVVVTWVFPFHQPISS